MQRTEDIVNGVFFSPFFFHNDPALSSRYRVAIEVRHRLRLWLVAFVVGDAKSVSNNMQRGVERMQES